MQKTKTIATIAAVLLLIPNLKAQTVGPNPQNFADAQATIAYLWQQQQLQQSSLILIQGNRALQLGKFIVFDFPRVTPVYTGYQLKIDVLGSGNQKLSLIAAPAAGVKP